MPYNRPSRSDVHVNRPLTNLSVAYIQEESRFVSRRVFPVIPSAKKSNLFFTFPRGEFNRVMMQRRAPGTESAGADYKIERDQFDTVPYGLHHNIDDQDRANVDDPLDLDRQTTMFLTLNAMLHREIGWVNAFFKTGVWTFEVDGAAARSANFSPLRTSADNNLLYWDNNDADPIKDIRRLKRAVLQSTGFMPNKLTLGRAVFDTLLDHPTIIDRIKYGQTAPTAAKVSRETLAMLFELDEVLVMDAIQNTAKEGADDSHSFIAGNHALLTYSPAQPGLMIPSCGYTFTWSGLIGGDEGTEMSRFRMQAIKSDRVEIEMAYDYKVVGVDLGCFINTIIQNA